MPFGDGRGPAGAGPMTGRGLGRCAGYQTPGYTKSFGRGYYGYGRGFGWHLQRRFDSDYYSRNNFKENETLLEEKIGLLEKSLKEIEKKISELTKKK